MRGGGRTRDSMCYYSRYTIGRVFAEGQDISFFTAVIVDGRWSAEVGNKSELERRLTHGISSWAIEGGAD